MPRKIGAKGWSALLAYPRLASTTRSCSFCLSVNKRSSMDRSLGPALPLLLLPLLLLLLSSLLVASLSPFPNAICNSSLYFFEPRLVVVLPSDEGRPFLIARVYKLPGTAVHACLAFTRELRCGRIEIVELVSILLSTSAIEFSKYPNEFFERIIYQQR